MMNLLFCINHTYIEQFIICLQSIVRFTEKYEIYVFHTDLTEEDKEKISHQFLSSLSFHFIYFDQTQLQDFPTTDRYPLEIYYRILAAHYLPTNIDKILYLDADIVVIQSLRSLYETDIENVYYAACTHVRKFFTVLNNLRLRSKKVNPYINTGVLLMNLKKLRKYQSKEEVFEYVLQHQKQLLLPDQDIISMLYGEKIKILDHMKYNLNDRMLFLHNLRHLLDTKTVQWVQQNCCIIHYYGRNKPWNKKYYGQLNVFYNHFIHRKEISDEYL